MTKLILNTLANGDTALSKVTQLNSNSDAIEAAIENTLSRDGTSPNAMNADLDMNGHRILNELASTGEGFIWEGPWVTATSYTINDMVSINGNSYICTTSHTSGVFATDLASAYWEIMASKGDDGAGAGSVTNVSATVPGGLSVTVDDPSTTPQINITTDIVGIVRADGANFAAATAGTHYLTPPTTVGKIQKSAAVSPGALIDAVAATASVEGDYVTPPTGTTILRGNTGKAPTTTTTGIDYKDHIHVFVYVTSTSPTNDATNTLYLLTIPSDFGVAPNTWAIATGDTFTWKVNATNLGTVTNKVAIKIGALTYPSYNLLKDNGVAVAAGDIVASNIITMVFTGTSFQLLKGNVGNTTATKLKTTGADVVISTAAPPTTGQVLKATSATTATWQAIAGGGDAMVANPLSQFAATTSAQLAGVISDETGTGSLVFAASPTITSAALTAPVMSTPVLGTPTSGDLTNCTFPTLNQSTTGNAATATVATTSNGLRSSVDGLTTTIGGSRPTAAGKVLKSVSTSQAQWGDAGTVTTTSVVSANGFTGSVANPTTTPAITLTTSVTGILKGNGTAISAATAGIDYVTEGMNNTWTNLNTYQAGASFTALANISSNLYNGIYMNITDTAAHPLGSEVAAIKTALFSNSQTAVGGSFIVQNTDTTENLQGSWGIATEAWSDTGTHAFANLKYLAGAEVSVIQQRAVTNTTYVDTVWSVGLWNVFKDAPDGSGLTPINSNQNSVGIYLTGISGHKGWQRGLYFDRTSLKSATWSYRDRAPGGGGADTSEALAVGIDMTDLGNCSWGAMSSYIRSGIALPSNLPISFSTDYASATIKYDSATTRLGFYNNGVEKFAVDMGTGGIYKNGVLVL